MKKLELFKSWYETLSPDAGWFEKTKSNFGIIPVIPVFTFAKTPVVARRFSFRFISFVFALIILITFPVTGVLAKQSLPGDMLYPAKRLVEEMSVGMVRSSEKKALLRREQVITRLTELSEVLENENQKGIEKALDQVSKAFEKAPDFSPRDIDENLLNNLSNYQEILKDSFGTDSWIDDLFIDDHEKEASSSATFSATLEYIIEAVLSTATESGKPEVPEATASIQTVGETVSDSKEKGEEKKEEKNSNKNESSDKESPRNENSQKEKKNK